MILSSAGRASSPDSDNGRGMVDACGAAEGDGTLVNSGPVLRHVSDEDAHLGHIPFTDSIAPAAAARDLITPIRRRCVAAPAGRTFIWLSRVLEAERGPSR